MAGFRQSSLWSYRFFFSSTARSTGAATNTVSTGMPTATFCLFTTNSGISPSHSSSETSICGGRGV
eukprot:4842316-Prymnesium_polylepis.2